MSPKALFYLSPFDCTYLSSFVMCAFTHLPMSLGFEESSVDSEDMRIPLCLFPWTSKNHPGIVTEYLCPDLALLQASQIHM